MVRTMKKDFSYSILRPDAPTRPSFTISEVPYQAKLDQNESPVDVPDEVKQIITREIQEGPWNRYPQPRSYGIVKKQFAESFGINPDSIILTAGCDQMILLAFLAAGGTGRTARGPVARDDRSPAGCGGRDGAVEYTRLRRGRAGGAECARARAGGLCR